MTFIRQLAVGAIHQAYVCFMKRACQISNPSYKQISSERSLLLLDRFKMLHRAQQEYCHALQNYKTIRDNARLQ